MQGLKKTKTDIVIEQVKDVLDVDNFADLAIKTSQARERLKDLDVFKFVDVILDTVKHAEGVRGRKLEGGGGEGSANGRSQQRGGCDFRGEGERPS